MSKPTTTAPTLASRGTGESLIVSKVNSSDTVSGWGLVPMLVELKIKGKCISRHFQRTPKPGIIKPPLRKFSSVLVATKITFKANKQCLKYKYTSLFAR